MSKKEVDGLKSNCKCKNNCQCKKENGNGYYMAVIDLTFHKVHYDVFNKQYVYSPADAAGNLKKLGHSRSDTFRFYNETFSKSIKEAVVKALNEIKNDDYMYSHWEFPPECSAFDKDNIFDTLEFDPTTGCFLFENFMTIGTRKYPKECQWERFFAGEYEFFVGRYEIQILKTELAPVSEGIIKDVSEAIRKSYGIKNPSIEVAISKPTQTIIILDE